MPQPARIMSPYRLDPLTIVDPAPHAHPRITARQAWLTATRALNDPASSLYPPAGGRAVILLGDYRSNQTVGPATRVPLAWVIILHDTAERHGTRNQRVSPPPNPPCYFGYAVAVVDTAHGKVITSGSGGGIQGDTLTDAVATPLGNP